MLIGFSSDTKKGYDVPVLIEYISSILDSQTPMNIAIIGMGHLGQAITKYFNGKRLKLKITAAFDIDPAKVGQTIDGIPCYHMDSFERTVEERDISLVIVSSPTKVAPSLVLPIINAGIKGSELHLHTAELPPGHRRRELRHHHAPGEGGLLRQGERGGRRVQQRLTRCVYSAVSTRCPSSAPRP